MELHSPNGYANGEHSSTNGMDENVSVPGATTTPARIEMCPYHAKMYTRTYRADTNANSCLTFVLLSKFPEKCWPLFTDFHVLPFVLVETVYVVHHWSQFALPCVTTPTTDMTEPKSICNHWPAPLDAALQACAESSIDRAC